MPAGTEAVRRLRTGLPGCAEGTRDEAAGLDYHGDYWSVRSGGQAEIAPSFDSSEMRVT